MDGSPEAATGTKAWPSLRRAKRPRLLNNPHSPRRSAAARNAILRASTLRQADNTEAVAVPLARRDCRRWGMVFPREALEPAICAANLRRRRCGAIWRKSQSFRYPPSAGSPKPYLAPYGYRAVTIGDWHSGRNVASGSQSRGKAKRSRTVTRPLTLAEAALR